MGTHTCCNCGSLFSSYTEDPWKRCPDCGFGFSATWSLQKTELAAETFVGERPPEGEGLE